MTVARDGPDDGRAMNPKVKRRILHSVKLVAWCGVWSWLDHLAALFAPKGQGGALIVKLDAIGDFVLSSPLIARLVATQEAKGKTATIVCDRRCAGVARLLFPGAGVIGIAVDSFARSPLYRWHAIRQLHGHYDFAMNLALSHDLLWADSVIRVCGAAMRLGFHGPRDRVGPAGYRLAQGCYDRLVEPASDHQFDAERIREGLETLGHDMTGLSSPLRVAVLPPQDHPPHGRYFVIAPGSLVPIKCWPPGHFLALARALLRDCELSCVLLGAPNDAAAGSVVEGGLPPDRVVNLVGKTSLAQAIATIRDAEFVVANDSALVHIAAACGVAAISTLGGGHPDRFLPYPPSVTWFRPPVVAQYRMDCYGCAWNCIYPIGPDAPAPCIAGITIAQVEQACHTVLGAPA